LKTLYLSFCIIFLAYRKCIADDIHCGPPVNADGATIPGTSGGRIADPCVPKEKKCDGKVKVSFLLFKKKNHVN
jgi:hypothetical protein